MFNHRMNRYFTNWPKAVAVLLAGLVVSVGLCAEQLSDRLRTQLSGEEVIWAEQSLDWPALRRFYEPHYLPIWITQGMPTERAEQWKQTLLAADNEGLDPRRYHLQQIEEYWQSPDSQQQLWLELFLTDAFLQYSHHVRHGRLKPAIVDPDWHIDIAEEDAVQLLRQTLRATDFVNALKSLPPPHAGYLRLRETLAQYRQLSGKRDFPTIPSRPKLYWGLWHDHIQQLRRRLILTGDLPVRKVQEPRFFDEGLKQAVEHFQHRHGLKEDGVVGVSTFERLNAPMSEHVRQIKLNMERWRWLPRQLEQRYIMVNTASYRLDVIEHDKHRLAMRVITGTPDRPTPVVGGRMQSIIINPYWYIPNKIAIEDLIPKQLSDPAYFKKKKIRVMASRADDAKEIDPADIDWGKVNKDNFPYLLRQDPGPANSLGSIKFPFLNNFAIYLHDTPQRQLFDQTRRAFSSGCVRVENPIQLASYLLNGEGGWTSKKLQEKIDTGEPLTVRLPEPIPIYLVYWTVWVGADNTVYFQKDIYDRDRPMAECG